jgi:hypothetical protein
MMYPSGFPVNSRVSLLSFIGTNLSSFRQLSFEGVAFHSYT